MIQVDLSQINCIFINIHFTILYKYFTIKGSNFYFEDCTDALNIIQGLSKVPPPQTDQRLYG
jgi:hypothetical protein